MLAGLIELQSSLSEDMWYYLVGMWPPNKVRMFPPKLVCRALFQQSAISYISNPLIRSSNPTPEFCACNLTGVCATFTPPGLCTYCQMCCGVCGSAEWRGNCSS